MKRKTETEQKQKELARYCAWSSHSW